MSRFDVRTEFEEPHGLVVAISFDRQRLAVIFITRLLMMCGWGGELLISTGDIVGRWKKDFEDLLNPTDLPSSEEAEAGDSEVDSSITQAEVTEVVHKLLSGKAPGVDEIRPEYLKSLDVVGLSWLTRLCNIAWRLGTVGITLLSLPGKVYTRVLERRGEFGR
ncbi:hypothetical protein L3Q82_002860 [Scortum barcoo]|uniref:Uncharacterized protein n=1 Tax=Scortum barcoo TaxID=214431 RepID=A0ACB8VUG4_9TELE|nr:hypothetical protein L3Q82_002860 [Scortum barcoo]